MAIEIEIPEDDLVVFKKITEIDDLQFKSLISALVETKPTLSREEFVSKISEKVKNIQPEEIESILRVLFILYMMKDGTEISSEEVAEDISESAAISTIKGVPFPQEVKTILRARLNQMLGFERSLAVTAKALDVMTESPRVFCTARILTDIRPVFTNNPLSVPAAVLIHNLQIKFHDSTLSKHQEFFVSLNTDDIQTLKELISRAEEKTVALQLILDKANIAYLKK